MNSNFPLHRASVLNEGIERRTTAGPTILMTQVPRRQKSKDDETEVAPTSLMEEEILFDTDSDMEKASTWKKQFKDATATDGKITIINQMAADKDALCCKYSEDYDYIAAGYTNGVIRVYSSSTGEEVYTLVDSDVDDKIAPFSEEESIQPRKRRTVTGEKNEIAVLAADNRTPHTNSRALDSDLGILQTSILRMKHANGYVKCWNYTFSQCLYSIQENRQTYGISYHPRFPKFVTYGDDQRIYFYDEESKVQERVLLPSEMPNTHDGHMSRIFAACFHPRNNYEFISGGWDSVVQFWDLRQPYAIRHLSGIHICGEGLDINAKGTEVLTCAFQKLILFKFLIMVLEREFLVLSLTSIQAK
ncbi:hypothetical protein NQ317_012367 [Molorchus minor]|uniref:Uncharacterized protein n=1 Tax=Molorchus minor TaxID=1323400 RepID=A0ABQ9JGR6_9CUCU|nr:hypothetical protein NQ317_012367 [Molorchus minor]